MRGLRPSEVNTSGAARASQRPAAAAGAGWDSAARAGHAGASGGVDPARCHAPQGAGARAGAASSWLSCIRRPVRTMSPAGETVGYGHQEPGRYWAARAHDAHGIRVNADSQAADGFQERAGTGRRRASRRATRRVRGASRWLWLGFGLGVARVGASRLLCSREPRSSTCGRPVWPMRGVAGIIPTCARRPGITTACACSTSRADTESSPATSRCNQDGGSR